jgi:hypothetical protein
VNPLGLTLLISVAVHVAAIGGGLALDAMWPRPLAPVDDTAHRSAIEIVEPDSEPVAVVLLDDSNKLVEEAVSSSTTVTMGDDRRRDRIVRSIASRSGAATTASSSGAELPVEPGRTVNPLWSMRRGPRVDLSRPWTTRDALDNVPAGTTPQVDVPETGRLQPSGRGTYRSNEGVFTGDVAADGSVKLTNARNLRITSWPDPRKLVKLPKAIGNGVASWYDKDDKTPADPDREAVNLKRPNGNDTRPDHGGTVPILGGGFDVTDAIMRRHKVDPYASRKLAYLDKTRDERVQIGSRYRKEQLAKSTELMQKNLGALWVATTDLGARKQTLFELWDECAEAGEASVVDGGKTARMIVLGWINAKLPAGSAQAYTTSELATFNRKRQSKAAFEPYANAPRQERATE